MAILTDWLSNKKIEYEEPILAPLNEVTIDFKGKNPFLICLIARPLLHEVCKITASSSREDDIRWDDANPNARMFYGVWRCNPEAPDRFSKIFFRVQAEGIIDNLKENTGSVLIKLRGHWYTTFNYKLPGAKQLWRLYNYMWYYKQRRAILDFYKDMLMLYRERVMKAYGISQGGLQQGTQ